MHDAALDRLVAKSELTDLLAEYANLIDWVEWDRLDAVFWPEATFDFGMFKGDFTTYRKFVAELEEGYARRLHMFALPSIDLDGDRAQIDVGCVILCRTDEPAPGNDVTIWGRYLLDAERRGDEWRFLGLTYVLNLFDLNNLAADDRGGPMIFGDGLSRSHPLWRPKSGN